MRQCWFMLVLLLTASEFETTCTEDTVLPPKHSQFCFSISFFILAKVWPKLNCHFSGSAIGLIVEHQCQPQAGFWQPKLRSALATKGQTLTEPEVSPQCWGFSPFLPAQTLLRIPFPTCTVTLSKSTSQESVFPSEMVLPYPSRFCMLLKDLPCAPSSALQNSIVLCLWKLLPFFHCWTATKLTIPIHSIQHAEGLLLLCQQLCFHLQLFTHPLRSLHRPDTLNSSRSHVASLSASFNFANIPGVQAGPLWRPSLSGEILIFLLQ